MAHNYYTLRCHYFHELNHPKHFEISKRIRIIVQKEIVEKLFCDAKCYKLSRDLYHKALCGKNDEIQEIINFINSDTIGDLNHLMLLVLKFFLL